MYHLAHDGADPVPLDFNKPFTADTVADAPDPNCAARREACAPNVDTESLLAEIGLPAHVARQVVAARSASPV